MEAFFDSWFGRLDNLRSDLLHAFSHRPDLVPQAVDAVLSHYRDYRDAKLRLADSDVLRALTHPWLTPFERIFLWVAGWKPSLAFRLLLGHCPLSPDQRAAVEVLRREVQLAEHRISEDMACAQEAMAGHTVLEAVRADLYANGSAWAAAADEVLRALRLVVGAAEELREATLRRLVAILTAAQMAEFLAAAVELRLRVRRWGLRRNGGQSA
ncbi:protein DOG1-like 4 [Curcuma longa]|uniref:protein DOG1-like 4 n=1 Tax=Curcuma longa TaxID=136217 RepID=UPI003D9FA22E